MTDSQFAESEKNLRNDARSETTYALDFLFVLLILRRFSGNYEEMRTITKNSQSLKWILEVLVIFFVKCQKFEQIRKQSFLLSAAKRLHSVAQGKRSAALGTQP